MNAIILFAILFAISGLVNYFERVMSEATACAIISGLLFAVYFILRKQNQKSVAFLQFLEAHRTEINSQQPVLYENMQINAQSPVTQYEFCISLLLVSLRLPSRYILTEHESSIGIMVVGTVASLLLGWWGIPWGPIYTVAVLAKNLHGGHKTTVASLLNPLDRSP